MGITTKLTAGWLLPVLAAVALGAGCSGSDSVIATGGGGGGTTRPAGPGTTDLQGTTRSAPGSMTMPDDPVEPVTPPTTGGGPVSAPMTTYPDPNTSLPETVQTTPTIPASGTDPAMIDCGILYRATGWPTTPVMNPVHFQCLADAFAAGTPARLVDREQTDGLGGAILVTTYDVLGPGQLRVTEDATEAADRPQVITVSMCTGVTQDGSGIVTSGCTVIPS